MAAKFGATIVPFAGVGSEDGFNMLLDSQELQRIPFLGDQLRRQAIDIPQARRHVPGIPTLRLSLHLLSTSRQILRCKASWLHADLGMRLWRCNLPKIAQHGDVSCLHICVSGA